MYKPSVFAAAVLSIGFFFTASLTFAFTLPERSATPTRFLGQDAPSSVSASDAADEEKSDGNSGEGDRERERGSALPTRAASAKDALQQVAERIAERNFVVPNASARRTLKEDGAASSTVEESVQGAKFVEKLRSEGSGDQQTRVRDALEKLTEQVSGDSKLQDFFKTIAPESSAPPAPVRAQTSTTTSRTSEDRGSEFRDGSAPAATSTESVSRPTATEPKHTFPITAIIEAHMERLSRETPVSFKKPESDTQKSEATVSSDGEEKEKTEERTAENRLKDLEQLGRSIRAIDTASQKVEKQVSTFVTKSIDTSIEEAAKPQEEEPKTGAFSASEREATLARVREDLAARGDKAANLISESVLSGRLESRRVDPVLKSSVRDIATLVQTQTGVPVSAPLGTREVSNTIQDAAKDIQKNVSVIAERDGISLYVDTDKDGISDYDEEHIYGTDPQSAYTSGGVLTDGEKVLLGFDPHASELKPVPVESPKESGVQTEALFEVLNIAVVSTTTEEKSLTLAEAAKQQAEEEQGVAPAPAPQPIRFSGKALPNSFVTLYVFSDPVVVTVKTDQNGLWTYVLDQPLPDGTHELYVAQVDDQGKILAKSAPVPFTKTAEALSFTPLTIQEPSAPTLLDTLLQNFLVTAGVLALFFILVGILALGFKGGGSAPTPTVTV